MDELFAEIMRRVEEYYADSPEGPYCRQEIVNGVREVLDDLKADAAKVVDRSADLVMDDLAMRMHPDYCSACDGFPCQGGHPPDGEA